MNLDGNSPLQKFNAHNDARRAVYARNHAGGAGKRPAVDFHRLTGDISAGKRVSHRPGDSPDLGDLLVFDGLRLAGRTAEDIDDASKTKNGKEVLGIATNE